MKRALIALAALLPALAFAHIGADAGSHHSSAFLSGFTHPFTGLDHMVAMLMVGVWSMLASQSSGSPKIGATPTGGGLASAGQTGGSFFRHSLRSALVTPAAFASVLLLGALAGFAGSLGGVEAMIAASLLVLGLLVALGVKLPVWAGALIAAGFAFFHGFAHGTELPAERAAAALAGMVLGTVLLHVAGMALARFGLSRNVWLPRLAGAAVAGFGAVLLAS